MANILLVEPDIVLAQIYEQALRQSGHNVHIATTAQDAIDAADDEMPDAVVLELQLVAHSGVEFLYEFRSYTEWRFVPVIILSTVPPAEFAASKDVLQHHLGVHAYHYKPHMSLKKLSQTVEAIISTP